MKTEVPTLLLVEEDELLADITAFRLELLGYTVHCVRTAADALQRLKFDPLPAVVIADTTLPDMSGIELIGQLNSSERTHNIPIMALSVGADHGWAQRAERAGAADCLVLPYDPAVLEQKIENLVAKLASTQKTQAR